MTKAEWRGEPYTRGAASPFPAFMLELDGVSHSLANVAFKDPSQKNKFLNDAASNMVHAAVRSFVEYTLLSPGDEQHHLAAKWLEDGPEISSVLNHSWSYRFLGANTCGGCSKL